MMPENDRKDILVMDLDIKSHGAIGIGIGAIGPEVPIDGDTKRQVEEAIRDNTVKTDPSLPSCCIDGRCSLRTLNGEPTQPRPGVAGGILMTGFAAAETSGWFADNDPIDRPERLKIINRQLKSQGLNPGGHCDKLAVEADFKKADGKYATNCGANDGAPDIINIMYDQHDLVQSVTNNLLGNDEGTTLELEDRSTIQSFDNWNPLDTFDVLNENGRDTIEVLEADNSPTHGHTEIALVVNNIEDTTIDRDGFFKQTGNQLFKLDMWYLKLAAKAMASGPHAEQQYSSLLNAMVAYQVATYIKLCNGSQLLFTIN